MDDYAPQAHRVRMAEGLSRFLADAYTLYLKTHNFHWNVTGPMFQTQHIMFMDQYDEQCLALDEIAERIRTLGFHAPGSYKRFAALASVKDAEDVPNAKDMIHQLLQDQETVVRTAREIFPIAENPTTSPRWTC